LNLSVFEAYLNLREEIVVMKRSAKRNLKGWNGDFSRPALYDAIT
jgi:hypothetical protein